MSERRYKDFDPFNHGTTTIHYQPTPKDEALYVSVVLDSGWNIQVPDNIQSLAVDMYHDPRYNRFSFGRDEFFIKRNRPNIGRQLIVDRVEAHARDYGVPTRIPVPTLDGSSSHLYLPDNTNWSLSRFLDGEHFDGSTEELLRVAQTVARMHQAFATIPFAEEVQQSINTPLKHDIQKLHDQLGRLKDPPFAELAGTLPLSPAQIAESSVQVAAEIPTELGLQIIHDDLHPHNFLFDLKRKRLIGIVDFEQVRLSQRVRDVGFAMHRFSRTYGPQTERGLESEKDIRARAINFLDAYIQANPLSGKELSALVLALKDEALQKISLVLGGFYDLPEQTAGELRKQVTLLKEADIFTEIV